MTLRAKTVSRRAFLSSLGAAAGMVPAGLGFAALPANPEVAVIGAGMAGLAAATALRRHGIDCVVLEAQNRIGGRAYTESNSFGVPFDHGCAALQSADRNPLARIARELGFESQDIGGILQVFGTADTDGTDANRLEAALGRLHALIDEAGETGRDIALSEVFTARDPWEEAALAILSRLSHGVEPTDLSVLDPWQSTTTGYDSRLPRGIGSLVATYGDGAPVSAATPVEEVDWRGPDVALVTGKGTLRAKAAIVTVSTGVLAAGRMRFAPALPVWKQEAIESVPMGLLNRIALQFRRGTIPALPGTQLRGLGRGTGPADFLVDPFDGGLVVATTGGTLAGELERAGDLAAIAAARSALVAALGSEIERGFRRARVTAWASDPWALGSLSAARPGRNRARLALGLPVADRLYFAGEAVAVDWPGQLAGAHRSGLAAAERYIAARR